jgi:predicted AlkP superfamily pyrophosphatase or phosphodiesterase
MLDPSRLGVYSLPRVHKTVVINAVGLTPAILRHMPKLSSFASSGKIVAINPPIPAVTCTSQATYLTGKLPSQHGIVGNGWYFRDECEIKFWRQSSGLVQAPRIWDVAKQMDSSFTCANLFWWYAMYSAADVTVTPRPMYPADGRKIPDVWTNPSGLRDELQRDLGQFPLFHFWGPAASIVSTKWIVDAALHVSRRFDPTLLLVYLPHLDYDLQRFAPDSPQAARAAAELDGEISRLLDSSRRLVVLSEYGITPVRHPVHLNRVLRHHNLLTTRDELGHELLDAGASDAFAVADHQIAHVYVNDSKCTPDVRRILHNTPGIGEVYEGTERAKIGLDHPRAGDFVVLAERDSWFTYYYWFEESRAPDFAHTVDIHRKPGYDPVELFLDPSIRYPKVKIGGKLLQRRLGMNPQMDVIPTDATLVKGSHGLPTRLREHGPMLIASPGVNVSGEAEAIDATAVYDVILDTLRDER